MVKRELLLVCVMAWMAVTYGQQQGQGQQGPQQGPQQGRPVQRFNGPQNGDFPGNFQRPNNQRPGPGQNGGQFGQNGFGPNGPNGFGPNNPNGFGPVSVNGPNNRGGPLQQRQQFQATLSGQPSLVNIGGCSRGVSLRNSDGSTLVCGFGPRDFACPPRFACTFDNGLAALVCCPSGQNATEIVKEKEEPQPNPCPDQEPIKDEFGNRLKCDFAGGPANTCPTGTLCVVGACCPVSVAGLIAPKPGKCPLPLPVNQGQNCQNDCTFDADCPGPAKCCFVGCGARCVASVLPNSPQNAPDNSINGPLSGNGASLARFNLQQQAQLSRQGGQQGPQQNNPFFNQQQQQFQFPNNGPPGTFGGARAGPPGQQQQQRPPQQQFQVQGQGQQQQRPPQQFQQQQQQQNRNRQFDQAMQE